jgi:cell division inhibitor SulA
MGSRLPTTSFLSNLQQRPLQTQLKLGAHLGAHISRQPFALSQSPGRKLTESLNSLGVPNVTKAPKALSTLNALDKRAAPHVWRATQLSDNSTRTLSSHHPALDAELPGGGWPCRQVTELLLNAPASGEIRLLMPLLRELTHTGKSVAFIAPPHLPFGPALDAQGLYIEHLLIISPQAHEDPKQSLTDLLWSAEQVLKSGQFEAVVVWCPKQVSPEQLRRLHHAASMSPGAVFICRPLLAQFESSAAPLRISLGNDIVLPAKPALSPAQAAEHSTSALLARLAAFTSPQAGRLPKPLTEPQAQTQTRALKALQLQILKRRGPVLQKPIQLQIQSPASAPATSVQACPAPQARPEQQAHLSQHANGFFLSGSFDQVLARLEGAMAESAAC